eukprot:TRINITY_DN18205_c0_g1_i1.p1 TRINITY_DN18205_c0_g1~~TRINITY_DN18205_c0_g1_i1.p1  ORF type:complete len:220 (+),score=33.32 TRINITY_DN18205_c0_g1_i1:47-706(+)
MAGMNASPVGCQSCGARLFGAGVAKVTEEDDVIPLGGLNPGYRKWFDINDVMKFDNISVLREHDFGKEENVVTLELTKNADEPLGTRFVDEDIMILEELLEGGAARKDERFHKVIGYTIQTLNGNPVSCCDDIRAFSANKTSITMEFIKKHPRILVCGNCGKDAFGFSHHREHHRIAVSLVQEGGEFAEPEKFDSSTPEGAQIAQMIAAQLAGAQSGKQ